ncbi:hypothetical protein D3C76_1305190 [compost metagenome]
MFKIKNIFVKILPILLVSMLFLNNIYADVGNGAGAASGDPSYTGGSPNIDIQDPATPNLPGTKGNVVTIIDISGNLWTTFSLVAQILAIFAIVIAGVRYMFASADQKADIKKQTIILVLGAVLVFSAIPIAEFVAKAANELLTP